MPHAALQAPSTLGYPSPLSLDEASPEAAANQDFVDSSQDFLDSVLQQSGELLVRVLLPINARATPEALGELCRNWLVQQGLPHLLQADPEGLWLRIDEPHNPVGLCASLQNDLSVALRHDIYVAYLCVDDALEALDASVLRALQETALAAQLLHSTEPLACDRSRRTDALNTFRDALQSERIRFERQPIAHLSTLQASGYELLARLHLEEPVTGRHLLAPEHWIPYVINSHDSIRLARRALMDAVQRLARHPAEPHYLSINLTALNFLDASLLAQLQALPETVRSRLVLELTEWKDPRLYAQLPSTLQRLRESGLRIAIDDFGAGYSSTEVLRDFEFDLIKLDIRLVQSSRKSDHILIDWTLKCAEQAGARVVAEGIETPQLLEHVRVLGLQYGQGWHIDALLRTAR